MKLEISEVGTREDTTQKLSLLSSQAGFPENANENQILPGTQEYREANQYIGHMQISNTTKIFSMSETDRGLRRGERLTPENHTLAWKSN